MEQRGHHEGDFIRPEVGVHHHVGRQDGGVVPTELEGDRNETFGGHVRDQAPGVGVIYRRAGAADQEALEMGGAIACNSSVAVMAAKKAIRQGWGVGLAAALEIEDAAWHATAFSADRREGIEAFNQKRAPQWPGA